jgi:riboflavin synthase alpha subunit
MDSTLKKKALFAIGELNKQLHEVEGKLRDKTDELELQKQAQSLAFNMFKKGSIAVEDLESTINEYSTKGQEELVILEKVAEISSGQGYKLGRVSDLDTSGLGQPLLDWIISD